MAASPTREPAERADIGGVAVPRYYEGAAAEYAAGHAGAVVIDRSHEGRVRAVGRDRLDLLHRMSTNDLNSLAAGQARQTVLTTPIARIVDWLWVLNLGETALCLTGPSRATPVRRWLSGYIFYKDQVKFEDASAAIGQFGLFGPRAGTVAEALLPGAGALEDERLLQRDGLIVVRGRPLAGGGYSVLAPIEQLPALWGQALDAGAAPAGEDAFQMLRLEAGRPYTGHELTEDYLPLEVNLWGAVSFTKGCYIGQEIIARMESRGKLARRLVGLKLTSLVDVGAEVRTRDGDQMVGRVTTAGVLPDHGPVALALLKTASAEAGVHVLAGDVRGQVANLPFGPVT